MANASKELLYMSNKKLVISASNATLVYPTPHGTTIKGYKKSRNTQVSPSIKSFCMDIYSESRIGVIGKNGAGKTTLLRLLSGIYPPTTGNVNIFELNKYPG